MAETQPLSLEEALSGLMLAVDRLETAAANRVSSGDLLLAGELRDAKEANARLAETNRVVGVRLDTAIDKLRVLLET